MLSQSEVIAFIDFVFVGVLSFCIECLQELLVVSFHLLGEYCYWYSSDGNSCYGILERCFPVFLERNIGSSFFPKEWNIFLTGT